MAIHRGKRESSEDADSDMVSIVEETSAELKNEHSPQRSMARKSEKGSKSQEFIAKGLDGLRRSSTKAGNGDESSTSPLTNNGDTNRHGDGNEDENAIGESEEYRVHWYKDVRRTCGKYVNDSRFQWVMVACIVVNAGMMGGATYFPEDSDSPLVQELSDAFQWADDIFLGIFTLELIMQFIYHGWALFLDGWLLFDFLIIAMSWFAFISTHAGGETHAQFQVFRVFRVFRAFRLITRVKIMKDLIIAMGEVMPRMVAICLMLMLIFYIFAVMFTQLYWQATYTEVVTKTFTDDFGLEYNTTVEETKNLTYFKDLPNSFLSLFQLMTMDEWAEIVRTTNKYKGWAWIYMIIFVVASGFIVVNLIVAVICDAIGALDEKDRNKLFGEQNSDSDTDTVELRDQIDTIEDQIGDLTRIQARTFHTLQYLTQQLQMEKEKTKGDATAPTEAAPPALPEGDPEEKKDRRLFLLKKSLSGERSRRKGMTQSGYIDKRKSYRDTWKEEGSDKSLRRAVITNFAKSARQLQMMREKEEKKEKEGGFEE